ncbi:MAG: methylmalonyl-CoA epimerase [Candidatus Dormibacteria bacterium]
MEVETGRLTIDHVGLAVTDLEAAVAFYQRLLGHGPSHRESLGGDGVEACFFESGPTSLELLSSADPCSPVGRFLERRGPGLHHLAYLVPDLAQELSRWSGWGAELLDQTPRPGARGRLVAFVHPHSAAGVLVELCQLQADPG